MHRLAPCLALALVSLPACKRERGGSTEPGSGQDGSAAYSEGGATPSPEQVCTRLSELATANLGTVDPEVRRQTIVECTAQMSEEKQLRGATGWDGVARCVMAAQNDADIDRCDQLYPPGGGGGGGGGGSDSTPTGEATKEDQVCVIMISTFAIELMMEAEAAGEPPPELADDDIRNAHTECLRSLEQARQTRSGTQYDQLLDCLAASDSGAAMDQCLGP